MNNHESHIAIKKTILYFEEKYDVDTWVVNNIHVWPYIRIKLFFLLINNGEISKNSSINEKSSNKIKTSFLVNLSKKIINTVASYFYFKSFINKIENKKIVFFGSHIHRVKHTEGYFNRFFDAMVYEHKLEEQVYMIEHQKVYPNNYNDKAIISLEKELNYFKSYNKIKNKFRKQPDTFLLDSYTIFYDELISKLPNSKYLGVSKKELFKWSHKIDLIAKFYTKLFKKIKPSKVVFPGYYAWDNLYAAVYSANKLKIETIDFQHGLQTNIHMVFSYWTKYPKKGYNIMPNQYWTWDNKSKENIEIWSNKFKNISSKVVGQPYLGYCHKYLNKPFKGQKKILYSLQLMPLSVMFNALIVNLILNSEEIWQIRLHPRNTFSENDVITHLESFGVLSHKYAIHDSRSLPLPEVFDRTFLHITAFSGCLIEAKILGIPTVIISDIGKEVYRDYIDHKTVYYLNQNKSDFQSIFFKILKVTKNRSTIKNETMSIFNPLTY